MEYIKEYIISFKRRKKKYINDFILHEIHLLKKTSKKYQTNKIFCNK